MPLLGIPGITTANALTTVSPTYAAEIATEACSGPLARAIADAGKPIVGIVNGIDYSVFNPATDSALPSRYDAEDASHKQICKGSMLAALELDVELERPFVLSAGHLGPNEGFDLFVNALPSLLKTEATFVVAGNLSSAAARKLRAARVRHRGSVALIENPDAALVRRLHAAADLAVLPLGHSPGGNAQLVAQRYGAAPVARSTGVVLDTIVDADAALGTGTGFLFEEESPEALVGALARGLAAFGSAGWPRFRRRIMRQDVGWDRPARRYLQVYRQTLAASG